MSEFLKNTSGQRIPVGSIYAVEDGALQTTGLSVSVSKDGGSEAAGAGTLTTLASGSNVYAPTQAETNCDLLLVTVYKASCTRAAVGVYTTTKRIRDLNDATFSLGSTAPAGWLNAAAFASGALNGKGDWNVGKTGYALSTAGNEAVAAQVEAEILNDATGGAVVTTIANAVAAYFDNASSDIAPGIIAQAVWSYASGRTLTSNPGLDANGIRSAVGLASANLATIIAAIQTVVDGISSIAEKIDTSFEPDGSGGYQFTELSLENAPTGGGGGGDAPTVSEIYSYFVAAGRADAFKADISSLLTATAFNTALPANFNLFSIDGSGKVQLTAAAMAVLFDDTNAATLLSDFFAGLIERFDASGDTPISAIATAIKQALFNSSSQSNKLAVDEDGKVAVAQVAGSYEVKILVTNSETSSAIAGASVTVRDSSNVVVAAGPTNTSGMFPFGANEGDDYSVFVSAGATFATGSDTFNVNGNADIRSAYRQSTLAQPMVIRRAISLGLTTGLIRRPTGKFHSSSDRLPYHLDDDSLHSQEKPNRTD